MSPAIRERWHTKRHPFFLAFAEGKLPLQALGRYQALHFHFVSRALASFGLLYARGYQFEEVSKMIAENRAEEEGLKAITQPGHTPHDHNELILGANARADRRGAAAGLREALRVYPKLARDRPADVEHSRRQIELCGRHLGTPELQARAEQVAEEICELRWASISELYRRDVLDEQAILPPGMA
jgi:hypothetical protein